VGPLVGAALARPFLDFDVELTRRAGAAIPEQFARDGEPAFRAREAALSRELADAPAMVLAPGGGWMTNAAAAAPLRPAGRIIYLRTTPAAALARLGAGVAGRPLLAAADDPLAALSALLARRSAGYESADLMVDTDGLAPADVAGRVVTLVRVAEGDG
jgi:shikimate kinase